MQYDKTISPDDHMVGGGAEAYFRTTDTALECILKSLADAGKDSCDIRRVLDFGCGYGRVYRALPGAFPNAELTACDLIEQGARFCAETFGGVWVKGHEDLSQIAFPEKFDLIWLGSVFTHLPSHKWDEMLSFLASITQPDGIVVFTVHGESATKFIKNVLLKRNPHMMPAERFEVMERTLPSAGFFFSPQALMNYRWSVEHGMDITEGEYGLTFTAEWWVKDLIAARTEWELVTYAAPGWGRNHDAVTIRRR